MTHKMLIRFLVLTFCCMSYNLHAEELNLKKSDVTVENSSPAATTIPIAVQQIRLENNAIQIVTDGKLNSFSSLRLSKPARLVIDLPGAINQLSEQTYTSATPPVSSVKVVPYKDKLRIIIEATDSPVFPEVQLSSTEIGLVISILEKSISSNFPTKSSAAAPTPKTKNESKPLKPGIGGAVTSQGHIASVNVEQKPDTTRVTLNITGNCPISDPFLVLNGISVSFGDCIVPTNWQGNLDAAKNNPVVSAVTLFPANSAKKVEAGMLIELNKRTKFSFSKDKQRLIIDLETPEIANQASVLLGDTSNKKSTPSPMALSAVSNESKTGTKAFNGKKISIDFDNAEIRQVFRLLADVSGENFIISDEVKGVVSIKLKDVPWEQALEIIIRNNNLALEHNGNIVEILTKQRKIERSKEDSDIRMQESRQKLEEKTAKEVVEGMVIKTIQLKHAAAAKMASALTIMLSQGDANVNTGQGQKTTQGQGSASVSSDINRKFSASISAEPNTNKIIVRDYISKMPEIEKLVKELDVPERQVMIEARIVVATTEFSRDFGIQWGTHFRDGSAATLGINSMDAGFGGVASAPPNIGQLAGSSGIATGISFGRLASNIQLDMRLSAATAANKVRVVASPKIITLNLEPAKIEQGQSTFVQTIDKNGAPNMTPVTATLSLDVTPTINSFNDSLKLKIDASDDSFGLPPPGAASVAINKRTATSTMLLKGGETVVIGGIFREQSSDGDSGVPFLKDIPLFGHLFKNSSIVNRREELLIFIKPTIIDLI